MNRKFDALNGRLQAPVLGLVSLLFVWPALTLYVCHGLPVAAAEIPGTIKVDVQRGLLTVDIRNAPLAEILRVIGDRAGLQMIIQGDVSTPVANAPMFVSPSVVTGVQSYSARQRSTTARACAQS